MIIKAYFVWHISSKRFLQAVITMTDTVKYNYFFDHRTQHVCEAHNCWHWAHRYLQ